MKHQYNILIILICFLFYSPVLYSQANILENYIQDGLDNNLSLKMKLEDYYLSLEVLNEAKGLFYPDISFNARYSRAKGGRIIEFPVGDMLNPVYSTLNQLTMSNLFSEISNQEFAFLRPKEHETKLRMVQPLLNSSIYYNKKIKENLVAVEKANMETYRRALVADIKTAYYSHLKAVQIREILLNTKELVEENIRVTRVLFENDKLTKDAVYRSEAELGKIMQQLAESEKAVRSSAAYFNFLLNRDLLIAIEIEEPEYLINSVSAEEASANALVSREEFAMLDAWYDAGLNNLRLQKTSRFPELVAVVDYGYQGTKYRFTGEDDFAMASLLLRWDIFNGSMKRSKSRQAMIQLDKIEIQQKETANAVKLEVITAYYDLQAAGKKIPAAGSELTALEEAYRMVDKKFRQGQANLIELLDSRTGKTNAEVGLTLARYDYLCAWAEFERVAGLFSFEKTE